MEAMVKASTVKNVVLYHLEDIFINMPAIETVWIKLQSTNSVGMVSVEKLWARTN